MTAPSLDEVRKMLDGLPPEVAAILRQGEPLTENSIRVALLSGRYGKTIVRQLISHAQNNGGGGYLTGAKAIVASVFSPEIIAEHNRPAPGSPQEPVIDMGDNDDDATEDDDVTHDPMGCCGCCEDSDGNFHRHENHESSRYVRYLSSGIVFCVECDHECESETY